MATPFAKVNVVEAVKLMSAEFLSLAVGTVPFGALFAPEKIIVLSPE